MNTQIENDLHQERNKKTIEQWLTEWAPGIIKNAIQNAKQNQTLAQATAEASQSLRDSVTAIGRASDDFIPLSQKYGQDVRQTRAYIVGECAAIVKQLEDVRKFFLSADHEKEIARLKEFVDLCERLKALKDSGFLDTVADTMLKL